MSAQFNRQSRRARSYWTLVILVFVVAMSATVGYIYSRLTLLPTSSAQVETNKIIALKALVQAREAENKFLQAQLDTADSQLVIEKSARLELESELRESQKERDRLHERLAFYEKLLKPSKH